MPGGDALYIGHQANPEVAAASGVWIPEFESFDHTVQAEHDMPRAKNNRVWARSRIRRTTRYDEVVARLMPDNKLLGYALIPPLGKPTSAGGVHTFKKGVVGTNTGSGLATVMWQEGVPDAGWGMIDAVANGLIITGQANGNMRVEVPLRGSPQPNDSTPPVVTLAEYDNDLLPFQSWLTYLIMDEDAPPFCVTAFRIALSFNRDPFFCFPTSKWQPSDGRGLKPTRFRHGDATGTIEITGAFDSYEDSMWPQFENEQETAWNITMEAETGGEEEGDVVPKVEFEMPRVYWTSPSVRERGNDPVIQQFTGEILDSPADLTGFIARLTNGLANYNGT